MMLQPIEKNDWTFIEINRITKESFTGVEVPPIQVLRREYDLGDIFVRVTTEGEPRIRSYAIVSEKWNQPYIWSLATDNRDRGQGLASSLLKEIEEYERKKGEREINLTTHVNNPAQKLYFDHGYRVKNVIDNYYLGGFDGLLMRKEL